MDRAPPTITCMYSVHMYSIHSRHPSDPVQFPAGHGVEVWEDAPEGGVVLDVVVGEEG